MTPETPSTLKRATPWFDTDQAKSGITLRIGGAWICNAIGAMEQEIQSHIGKALPKKLPIEVTIEKECEMDTAGACLIARVIKGLKSQNRVVNVTILSASPFLNHFLTFEPAAEPVLHINWKTKWLENLGRQTLVFGNTSLKMLGFFGEILVTWMRTLKSTCDLRWVSVFRHGEEVGVKALPIIGLISFLIGMVLCYQSINQLRRFGAELYTIDFLGVSILREISVLITAIVIAGRSGSAFTAQIGTMALNQEIDAIRMLGLNPILVLVIPRILAILICLPLLVFFSMMMGLLGGMVLTSLIIDVTPLQFVTHLQRAVSLSTFWVGMSKAPMFAVIIGLVGCFRGLQVKGSAESVGKMTTQSVVESIFLVIVCDALMSIIFSYLKV
ncbi:MAG: ABC transporter permease [Alphaproteobacteria bacterium]|jgi:phospholipid/cholesterol/gamma-HCH transport system permease protein|nr:ABC transporter permease [Alphaproteobacteria bacterium]